MIDMGSIPPSKAVLALGINDKGEVVGYGDVPSAIAAGLTHAFLYNGSTITDLSSALNGTFNGVWSQALGINDSGQIVGF